MQGIVLVDEDGLMASKTKNDGESIEFGQSNLRDISTPGHTPGSLSYAVDEKYVFTGDILFIESIGRPDHRDKAEEFAGELYDSLHNKLLKLPSDTNSFSCTSWPDCKIQKRGIFNHHWKGKHARNIAVIKKKNL